MGKLLAAAMFLLWPFVFCSSSAGEFICGTSDSTPTYRGSGPVPHTGDTRALIILVKFKNDSTSWNSCFDYWPYSLGNTLPGWATGDSLICDTTDASQFIPGSLSDFWDTMSQGEYCFYGDVYDSVYIPAHRSPWYVGDYGKVNLEILSAIDTTGMNFALYDNNPKDGVADAILMCYRNDFNMLGGVDGKAGLGLDSAFTTNDTVWVSGESRYVRIEPHCFGSGTTQVVLNRLAALQAMAHEWGHFLLGTGHTTEKGGCWVLMDGHGAGIAMSAYERLKLGWVTPIEVGGDSLQKELRPTLTTGDVAKVVADTYTSPDSLRGYYLVENRQRTCYYDSLHDDYLEPCLVQTPGTGLLVTEVWYNKLAPEPYWEIDIECADGLFYPSSAGEPDAFAGIDTLDVWCPEPVDDYCSKGGAGNTFNEVNNNTFAPYTNPNTYIRVYEEDPEFGWWPKRWHTGFGLCNVEQSELDSTVMIADFFFGMPESTIDVTTEWKGRIILERDVAVTDTLRIPAGTLVWIGDDRDWMASGIDTLRCELIVDDGGVLEVTGAEDNPVLIVPDESANENWAAGDWYGLVVNSGGKASLEYCELGYGVEGVRVNAGTVFLEHCTIHDDSLYGVHVVSDSGDNLRVRSSVFEDNPIGIATASANVDLGDMTDPGPWNAGWNSFVGGNAALTNTSGDTILAEGNYWGSDIADTVDSRIGGAVDYEPWLPLAPSAIHPDLSCATVTRSYDDSVVKDDFVRKLCPEGDTGESGSAYAFEVVCAVKDTAGDSVSGFHPAFIYVTTAANVFDPPTDCDLVDNLMEDPEDEHEFWCVSDNTLFASDSTDDAGETVIIEEKISGRVCVKVQLHLGPTAYGPKDSVWINSADFILAGASKGGVDLADIAAFTTAITEWNINGKGTWWCDFIPVIGDTCSSGKPAYGISLADISWFTGHISHHEDSTSCDSE